MAEEQKEESKQESGQPHVQILGEEASGQKDDQECQGRHERHDHWHVHHQRQSGGMVWGLLILLGGFLLLLNNFGVVPWQVWDFIWPFWPALLILIGVSVIFGSGWAGEIIIFLITLAVLGFIFIFGLIHVGSPLVGHLPGWVVNFVNQFNIKI